VTREEQWLFEEKYGGEKTEGFFTDCERLKAGEPLAYVIGHIPFLNTVIHLDSRPLIPRAETEFWVQKAIDAIGQGRALTNCMLDLCAGSGCIGVALLKEFPHAIVDFEEMDTRHHPTILRNIHENKINEKHTRIFGGYLFENVSNQYDFIFANPPYIDPRKNRADQSVKKFEPQLALYGGKDGMELIETIIRSAPNFLKPKGTLYIEHEPEQSKAVLRLAKSSGFNAQTFTDQYGLLRYTRLSRRE
jgi:release factor glutamine methyltransferase